MTKIRYVGPFVDGVYLESPKHGAYTVAKGDTVDIVDEDFARSLLEQPTNWQLADEKPKPTPTVAAKPAQEPS